ncbi:hypothetical protein [Brucella sp. 10RB9213]|uniref:hypothetical protein n=1 Tax=Brucella sp. 10RB9213 TaxID=1844039 RepID=UPI0012AE5A82|nr:hypothetical protein [Brucella sp. 10RB9213]MRN67987.1 hypothetical protein [Brucella sp. 10RB9213]
MIADATIDLKELENACEVSMKEHASATNEEIARRLSIQAEKPAQKHPFAVNGARIDWGQDDNAEFEVETPTAQQLLAQEIKSAQAAADGIYAKRVRLVSDYQRRALEIHSLRERLSKLELAQKGTIAKIRVCDKAAKAHRQNVFALQEAGR